MKLVPFTFDGNTIHDNSTFKAVIVDHPMTAQGKPSWYKRGVGDHPGFGGKEMQGSVLEVQITILHTADFTSHYDTLQRWFEPSGLTLKKLIAKDADDSDEQYYVWCTSLGMGVPNNKVVSVMFALDSPIWLTNSIQAETIWQPTASNQTVAVTLDKGNLDAYPVYALKPTTSKNDGAPFYGWRKWVCFKNDTENPVGDRAVHLQTIDTAALVTAGKAAASGINFRVKIDGKYVRRWFGNGFNHASTKVWVNLQKIKAGLITPMHLQTALGTGNLTSIRVYVNETYFNRLPKTGLLMIDSTQDEVFYYTKKSRSGEAGKFVGVFTFDPDIKDDSGTALTKISRAERNYNIANVPSTHAVADHVYFIQFDIWFEYGDKYYLEDDPYLNASWYDLTKPLLDLVNSSNTSYVWDDLFYQKSGHRTEGWIPSDDPDDPNLPWDGGVGIAYPGYFNSRCYTANHGTYADPATEIGVRGGRSDNASNRPSWTYIDEGGMTAYNIPATEGNKYNILAEGNARLQISRKKIPTENSWVNGYLLLIRSAPNTWDDWTTSPGAITEFYGIRLIMLQNKWNSAAELAKITLTMTSKFTITYGDEEATIYNMDVILTNTTTGEFIRVKHDMQINQELIIDTLAKKVRIFPGGGNAFHALSLLGDEPERQEWLKITYGTANTIKITELYMAGYDVQISWLGRHN